MRPPDIAKFLALPSVVKGLTYSSPQPDIRAALPRRHDTRNPQETQSKHVRQLSPGISNVTVRYKKTTICEKTEGVNSYSGYIDLDEQSHLFFWFFEARQNSETAPITLWLNGGPGSDGLLGLFTGICFPHARNYLAGKAV
jgi:carboxypeptidase C (cathepsin A)